MMKALYTFCCALLLLSLAYTTQAATWYVSNTGVDNTTNQRGTRPSLTFLTVDFAIGQATAGDVIFLMPGTVYAGFTVNKRVTIEGSGTNITRGSVCTTTVNITAAESGSSQVVIRNITFRGTRATWNHGLRITTGYVTVDNCVFIKSNADGANEGAGIAIGTVANGTQPDGATGYSASAVNYNAISITNCSFDSEAIGIWVFDNVSLNNSSSERFVVRNNQFRSLKSNAVIWQELDSATTGKINNALIQNVGVTRHRSSSNGGSFTGRALWLEKGNRVRIDHLSIADTALIEHSLNVGLKYQGNVTGWKFSNIRLYKFNNSNSYSTSTTFRTNLYFRAFNTWPSGTSGNAPTNFPKFNSAASYSWLDTLEISNSFFQGGHAALQAQYAISNVTVQNCLALTGNFRNNPGAGIWQIYSGDYGTTGSASYFPSGYDGTTNVTFRRFSVQRNNNRMFHQIQGLYSGTSGNAFATNGDPYSRTTKTAPFTAAFVASGYKLFRPATSTPDGTVATTTTATQLDLVSPGVLGGTFAITAGKSNITAFSAGTGANGSSLWTHAWDNVTIADIDTTVSNGILRTNSSDAVQAWYLADKSGFASAVAALVDGDQLTNLPIGNFFNSSYTIGANVTLQSHGCERYTPNRGISYNNLTISDNKTLTLNGDIVVKGTLTINNGAKLNLNGYALVLDSIGTLSYVGTGCITGGTGSGIIVKQVTGTGVAVTINMDQTSASTRTLEFLEVNRATAATVTLGTDVNITNYLKLNRGSLTVGANTLTIGTKFELGDTSLATPGALVTSSSSSIVYQGPSPFVIPNTVTALNNLSSTGGGDLVFKGFVTISGSLTYNGNIFMRSASGTYTFNGPVTNSGSGRFIGAGTSTALTIGSSGSGARTINGSTSEDLNFSTITINSSTNGTTLSGNITANNWVLTSGTTTLNAGKYTCNADLARTTGTVIFGSTNTKLILAGTATAANALNATSGTLRSLELNRSNVQTFTFTGTATLSDSLIFTGAQKMTLGACNLTFGTPQAGSGSRNHFYGAGSGLLTANNTGANLAFTSTVGSTTTTLRLEDLSTVGNLTVSLPSSSTLSFGTRDLLGFQAISVTGGTLSWPTANVAHSATSLSVSSGATASLAAGANITSMTGISTVNGTLTFAGESYLQRSGSGSFTLASTGQLNISSNNGINNTGTTGNLRFSAGTTLSGAAYYLYNGGSAQSAGNLLPSTLTGTLEINNSNGVSQSTNLTIGTGGTLLTTSGFLDLNGFNLDYNSANVLNNTAIGGDALSILTLGGSATGYAGRFNMQASPNNSLLGMVLNRANSRLYYGTNDVSITGDVTFTSGYIKPVGSVKLIFQDGATATSASNNSFAYGTVAKIGNDAFTFPVGDTLKYAGIGIGAPSNLTDRFEANYNVASGGNLSNLGTGIAHITNKEHWNLNRTVGSSAVAVTLSWNDGTFSGVSNLSDLRVARYDGSNWVDAGNASTTGSASAGTLTSNSVSSFSPFTFGSSSFSNPLPVTLVSFTGKITPSGNELTWVTATESNNKGFDIERSLDGNAFEKIGFTAGKGTTNTRQEYRFLDGARRQSAYYRLNQIDLDGKSTLSPVIYLNQDKAVGLSFKALPNPANDNLNLEILSSWAGKAQIRIINSLGMVLSSQEINLGQGLSNYKLDCSTWPAGAYTIQLTHSQGQAQQRIIKR